MKSTRRTAVVTGVFFLITEFTAIGGVLLYGPVLSRTDYIVGAGADTRVLLGALLEGLLVIAVVGTSVALYPVVKRQNQALALGYVCARVLEAAAILFGIVSLLAVVTLRQDLAGSTDADAALVTVGRSLVAMHEWTFLLGPNLALGVGTVLLASLMYASGLVPRVIAVLGLIGGSLIFVSGFAVMFGFYTQLSPLGGLAGLPVLAWEVSLGIWLIVKGFRPVPGISIEALPATSAAPPLTV